MDISLEIPSDLNQTQIAHVFLDIAMEMLKGDLESKELMDGSFRFKTSLGACWMNAVEG